MNELERRIAVKVLWFAAGKPAMSTTAEQSSVVSKIMQAVAPSPVPDTKGGRKFVREICRQCAKADAQRKNYTGARKAGGGGHNKKSVP